MTIRVVADAFALGIEDALAQLPVQARIVEKDEIPRHLHKADALIVRSTLRVDADLLQGTPVRFVATATVGDDHLDKHWLQSQSIVWANAAGSSTDAVVEYIAAAWIHLRNRGYLQEGMTIGVVGVGRIGSRVAALAERLGFSVLRCDPPRAEREGNRGFTSWEETLAQADLLTLHVPLTYEGKHATFHLLDEEALARFRGVGIINAARGDVLKPDACAAWLDQNPKRWIALDCWPDEPACDARLLNHPQLALATPHIAGHSLDGKARNTEYACRALADWLGVPFSWRAEAWLPQPKPRRFGPLPRDPWQAAEAIVARLYPIARDDAAMRAWRKEPADLRARRFQAFRRHYPPRHGWKRERIVLAQAPDSALAKMLAALGLSWEVQ